MQFNFLFAVYLQTNCVANPTSDTGKDLLPHVFRWFRFWWLCKPSLVRGLCLLICLSFYTVLFQGLQEVLTVLVDNLDSMMLASPLRDSARLKWFSHNTPVCKSRASWGQSPLTRQRAELF